MDVRVGPWRKLNTKELMLLNCVVGEDSWESLGHRSNQSIPKEINPEYALEDLMLKLKLQYFGYLMWRANSLEKTLMLGKIEGRRKRGRRRIEIVGWHHQLDGHEFEQAQGAGDGRGSLVCCNPWVTKSWIRLSDWTDWLTDWLTDSEHGTTNISLRSWFQFLWMNSQE